MARLGGDEIESQWARCLDTMAQGPATLLHSDHIGNTYVLPGDLVGFLD